MTFFSASQPAWAQATSKRADRNSVQLYIVTEGKGGGKEKGIEETQGICGI